ncbi:MAG: hypothetical protein HY873_02270 [Chloroflexi bacterium]|nr:hypothetical protein [Chloroflexota bacterium]
MTRIPAPRALLCAAALLPLALSACDRGSGSDEQPSAGNPRAFAMGISTLPRELNAQAYAETFELAADAGGMVLIQRTPPWQDFLPGASVGDETTTTTAAEIDAIDANDLTLFFAIDPTDGATGRDRLAGLPASHEGRDFSDPDIRAAFASYAEYVVINYRPAYLALGVEMNLYYQENQEAFEDFISLYEETYDRVKSTSPQTQVTVTFQFEDLQSLLPTEDRHFPDWPLIARFEDRMDVMAISTYPSFAYARATDIPDNYYSQLRGFTDKPIVIAEMGFASEPGETMNSGSETEQSAFVARILREAASLSMPAIIWFAAWDPAYAEGTAFSAFQHIGLLHTDGAEKPAWSTWRTAALRPHHPPSPD